MPQVVIQPPGFNDPVGRKNWKRTIDGEIGFDAPPYSLALSPDETGRLLAMHPGGRARFWGSVGAQDGKYDRLAAGDIVLFTGDKHVQAVGQVGVILRNAKFGDLLWDPDPDKGSWRNIYSLQGLDRVRIPYEEIWELPGFSHGDNFMGMRILNPEKARAVTEGLRIQTADADPGPTVEEAARLALLAASTGRITAAEAFSTDRTSYQRPAGTVYVQRAESLLITAFRDSLPGDPGITLRTPTGLADFYDPEPGGALLVEAKSSARHAYVRQALSQLLDYARFAPEPVLRLAALFPQCPEPQGTALLHHYGIDCIYLDKDGTTFTTLPAPLGAASEAIGAPRRDQPQDRRHRTMPKGFVSERDLNPYAHDLRIRVAI